MEKAKFNLNQNVAIDDATNDDTLIISGVAADINRDRYDNYLTPETIESLCEQAKNTNLHLNHDSNKIIGRNYDAEIKNNQLIVKSKILPEYSKKLREELEFGINYAESISGISTKNVDNGEIINYDLLEISLTDQPVNQNTYATVQIDDQKSIKTDCLGGVCYTIQKEAKSMAENETIQKEDIQNIVTENLEKLTDGKFVTTDDLNNAFNEYKEDMLNTLREEFKNEIKAVVTQAIIDAKNNNEDKSESEEKQASESSESVQQQVPIETMQPQQVKEMVESGIKEGFEQFSEQFFKRANTDRDPSNNGKFSKELDKKGIPDEPAGNPKMTTKEIAKFYLNGGFDNE